MTTTPKRSPAPFDERAQHESDEAVQARHAAAARLCQRCPELAACTEWAASTPPSKRPGGVVAGRVPLTKTERNHTP